MRKLKLQVQMSIDGFIAAPGGEMDGMVWDWDDDLKRYVDGITESVDCIALGRKLAQGFIPYWASVAVNSNHPERSAGKKFTETKKVVFTRTLDRSEWPDTVLAKNDIVDEIDMLKRQEGNDIIAYGGASFVSSLIHHDLIDEYHLFVNPVVLGKGLSVFDGLEAQRKFALDTTRPFSCGIVLLLYRRAN